MRSRKQNVMIQLPADAAGRKGVPIMTGVLDYFPAAIAEVARVSQAGNDQHNPGEPLHWSRGKSVDHADCLVRHLIQRGQIDEDGFSHTAKVAWRALALLQEELEYEAGFTPVTLTDVGGTVIGAGETMTINAPVFGVYDEAANMPDEAYAALLDDLLGEPDGKPECASSREPEGHHRPDPSRKCLAPYNCQSPGCRCDPTEEE